LSLDLLYAVTPDADVCLYMMDNGLSRDEYDWFMKGEPPGYQIMGNDYYGRNDTSYCPMEVASNPKMCSAGIKSPTSILLATKSR
jgi:hypothetical protein